MAPNILASLAVSKSALDLVTCHSMAVSHSGSHSGFLLLLSDFVTDMLLFVADTPMILSQLLLLLATVGVSEIARTEVCYYSKTPNNLSNN